MPSKKNYHAKLLPNQCYHIYNHAVGQENLFKKPENYEYFWERWNKYISPYFTNYAYCLMPNHFHVLSKAKAVTETIKHKIEQEETRKGDAFLNGAVEINTFYESQFKRFFNSYTNAINKQEEKRHGGLFKAKFKRTLVSTQEDFLYFLQYIHHNPIHHGFTDDFLEWEYCSYHAYHDSILLKGIAQRPVLKLFINDLDETDLQDFIQSHQVFKRDFRKLYRDL